MLSFPNIPQLRKFFGEREYYYVLTNRGLITEWTKNGEDRVLYALSSLILKILKAFWISIMVISNISDTVVICVRQ